VGLVVVADSESGSDQFLGGASCLNRLGENYCGTVAASESRLRSRLSEDQTFFSACGERMERGNEESKKWRIEIVPASGVRDSVEAAAIEECSARLSVDGKIRSMCADVVRIKVDASSHISESPDEQNGNNDNPDPRPQRVPMRITPF